MAVRVDAITARGGTNIDDALQCALRAEAPPAAGVAQVLPIVVFLTDGQPTLGETDRARLLTRARASNQAHARVFVFGVGDDLDA